VRKRLLLTLLWAGLLWPTVVSAQAVVRGPYLQRGTPDSMTVVWRTDVETEGVVRWGAAVDALDQTSETSPSSTQHEVRLTGLEPSTRYYYSVGDPDGALVGGDTDHFFETAPTAGSTDRVRMWVLGDSGTGQIPQGDVRDAMLTEVGGDMPDIFLHVGDMAYNRGTDSEFQDHFFDVYAPILRNTVCWPAMGNHEGRNSDSQTQEGPYYQAYVLPTDGGAGGVASGTEAYYSFDYANIHFVVLDSHDTPRESTGTMAQWLEQDLAATDQDWIIAFWHHPPYTRGSHNSDSETQLIEMREEILPILEAGGVDLTLTGHSHIYERSFLIHGAYDTPTTADGYVLDDGDGRVAGDGAYVKPRGVSEGAVHVVAGHGGRAVSGSGGHPVMFFSEVDYGSCIIDVDDDALHLRNVRRDGVISDQMTLLKGDGLFLLRPAPEERLQAGEPYEIRWAAEGVRAVDVEFSADDGDSWTVLAEDVDVTTLQWDVPARPTNLGRIRLTDVDQPDRTATNPRPFVITDQQPRVVVPFGSTWRYDDDGGDYPDDGWTAPSFDDSAWPSGAAELGYGDGDEATELLDEDPNIPSVLFRHTVELDRPVDAFVIEALYDDAIAVWVNGERVHRKNMSLGHAFDLFASANSDDNATTRFESGPANPFVVGENTIAVMVKQGDETSSDLSFDLQLTVTAEADFPDPTVMDERDGDMGAVPPDLGTDAGTPDEADLGPVASDVEAGHMDIATEDESSSRMGGGGCSCGTARSAPGGALLFLIALLGLRRRRLG
jgi:hypothetical protein